MSADYNEEAYENALIELFQNMGWEHVYGPEVERDWHSPLYDSVLEDSIRRLNPKAAPAAIDEALLKLRHFENAELKKKNALFMDYLQNGIEVSFSANGETKSDIIYIADFNNPSNNSFIVANQWTFIENSNKRPDILLFLNGLPVCLFELKSPSREQTDASEAYTQIRNYMQEIPLNLLRETIGSYNAYCEGNEELTEKKRNLNKNLEFINHLRNKVSGHLSDEALDKMIQWIPEIYDENSKQNATYQEYQIYRALIEIAINSYQTPDGDQKQFGKEIDIQIPEYRHLFFDYLLQTVNNAINFLECIQDVIRPKLVYFEYPKDERSKEEQIEFYKHMAELANECVNNPDTIDENTSKMKEMYEKLGWNLDAFKEAAETDFKLTNKGR